MSELASRPIAQGAVDSDDFEPPAERRNHRRRGDDALTRWAIGVVLATLLGAAAMSVQAAYRRFDDHDARISDTSRRITALETAFAALQAANVEQHRALLSGVDRIERRLDTIQPQGQRP